MPGPLAFGIAIAATALANWACGDSRPTPTDSTPTKPKPDADTDVDAGSCVGAAPCLSADAFVADGRPDVFIPDVTPSPDIRDVYIPPDTGPHQTDVGFTDSGLDAGTPDLGVMDAGRPPCNPTNLEAFDGYDDNCNGNNNALAEMKRVTVFFEELHQRGTGQAVKSLALGDINNDGYGDLAVGVPTLGAVWVYLGGRDSPQLTHYEPGSTITVKSLMGNSWGLQITTAAGQISTFPASRGFVIHEDYSENSMGLGTALAIMPVVNPNNGQRYNELWIGAGAFNHSFGNGVGNRLDTGAMFRLDARGNNPATRMVSHSISADPIALAAINLSVILGESRQGPANNPTRPGSILGSEIIRAGDVNGFANGAEEVVLPYFQQNKVAIVSALAVTQPSQRIQTIVDLLNQQGYLVDGGIYFARTDRANWAFPDIDVDGRNDMVVSNPGDAILDQGAGKVRILRNGNLWPMYPQSFDPMEDSSIPISVWRMTLVGVPGTQSIYGTSLGGAIAEKNGDLAVGGAGSGPNTGEMFTMRGDELSRQTSGQQFTVSMPLFGGRKYSDNQDRFNTGKIIGVNLDGDGFTDFVIGTLNRSAVSGQNLLNGGLDLICGDGRMGNGRTMSSTVTQGSVTSLACERMYGPTGARIGRVNQNAVYDLNNDGTDEIGTCDEQAKCFVLLGGR